MHRWIAWSSVALLLTSVGAAAQSYPSALPLRGADQSEYEQRLANILEFARPNQVTRFRLPSGRAVSVRSYQPTLLTGDNGPCRGYRVDLSGDSGFMAVDGFRCQSGAGTSWRLVEPETVLAQSGGLQRATQAQPARAANEPLYADDNSVGPSGVPVDANGNPIVAQTATPVPAANVPVPRRRPDRIGAAGPVVAEAEPRTPTQPALFPPRVASAPEAEPAAPPPPAGLAQTAEQTILLSEPQAGEPAYVTQLRERMQRARELEQQVAGAVRGDTEAATTTLAPTTPVITPTPEPDSGELDTVSSAPASTVERAPSVIPPALSNDVDVAVAARDTAAAALARPLTTGPSRIVGETASRDTTGYAADPRIVAALTELKYLSVGPTPSRAAVNSAVDEFATDERFALPIENAALLGRLNNAVGRSGTIPPCNSASPGDVCLSAQ